MSAPHRAYRPSGPRFGLARALSKLGYCSRSQARELIEAARVWLNGVLCRDWERSVQLERDRIEVDGQALAAPAKVYMMLNKPRGLITTRSDEHGRPTVYKALIDPTLPYLAPVGRLDKASEGLLLLTNDTQWADRLLAPESHLEKRYHVQVNCRPEPSLLDRLVRGLVAKEGDFLAVKQARILRQGTRNSWIEIVLDEGKNRHIRRLLECCGVQVLRLIRVAIGSLELGPLSKGAHRHLTASEVRALISNSQVTERGYGRQPYPQPWQVKA